MHVYRAEQHLGMRFRTRRPGRASGGEIHRHWTRNANKIYNAGEHAWFESIVGRGPATASSKQTTTLFMKSDVKEKAVSIAVSIVEDDGPAREILTDWIRHEPGFPFGSQDGSAGSRADEVAVGKAKRGADGHQS